MPRPRCHPCQPCGRYRSTWSMNLLCFGHPLCPGLQPLRDQRDPKLSFWLHIGIILFRLSLSALCQLKLISLFSTSDLLYCAVPKFCILYPVLLIPYIAAHSPALISTPNGLCGGCPPPRFLVLLYLDLKGANLFRRICKDSLISPYVSST